MSAEVSALVQDIGITKHAARRFMERSGIPNLDMLHARQAMRHYMAKGSLRTRNGSPAIYLEGWIFVLSDEKDVVITCYFNNRHAK